MRVPMVLTDGFELHVRDITVNMGAEMIVVIAGPIMRMPGLPKSPQAERIDVVMVKCQPLLVCSAGISLKKSFS